MDFIKEFIFPEERQECHASTLLECREAGQFLAACFDGSREGKDDVGILMAHREAPGQWSFTRWKVCNEPHWNPVLYRLPDGCIACYFKVGSKPDVWRTLVRYSADDGRTWTEPAELVPGDDQGGRGPVKNKPIALKNGTILAPASFENNGWQAFADISVDGGRSWHISEMMHTPPTLVADPRHICATLGCIQPTFWEDGAGVVHAFLRSNNGWIYSSCSYDGGQSWQQVQPTAIPNNNSGLDLVRRDNDGTLWLLCNPVGGDWGARNILALYSSNDNGISWQQLQLLENEPLPKLPDVVPPEFSYPAIIATREQRLAATYTYNRKNIAFILEK